jgi:hypothetical protein
MCFSATASFSTAVVTGLIGVIAVARTDSPRDFPLASIPLFFAAQQFAEGGLWLNLPVAPESAVSSWFTHAYLIFALVFWPVFAPLAALLIEPQQSRRRAIAICLAFGICVAAYFLWLVVSLPHTASIVGGCIRYETGSQAPYVAGGFYLLATTFGLLLSSHRAVVLLGLIVLAGYVTTLYFYEQTFISVWCFYAAAASVVIIIHFERVRAMRRALTPKF